MHTEQKDSGVKQKSYMLHSLNIEICNPSRSRLSGTYVRRLPKSTSAMTPDMLTTVQHSASPNRGTCHTRWPTPNGCECLIILNLTPWITWAIAIRTLPTKPIDVATLPQADPSSRRHDLPGWMPTVSPHHHRPEWYRDSYRTIHSQPARKHYSIGRSPAESLRS